MKMYKRKFVYIILVIILLLGGCNIFKSISSINSSKKITQKVDAVHQKETKHFKFHCKEQDNSCLKDLSYALEENFTRITNDLHTSLKKKIDVYIYSDLSAYHKAINQPDAPSWLVGNAVCDANIIQIVNPSNADGRPYSDFLKVIVHEFTHIVEYNINSDVNGIPKWLDEGVAVFEAEQDSGTDKVLYKAKSDNNFPSLKDLETDSYTFGNMKGYQFSYSIIDYLLKTYKYDKLIAIIKSPSDFEKILGESKEDFQKKWIANLN
jgi:hypothetical protein